MHFRRIERRAGSGQNGPAHVPEPLRSPTLVGQRREFGELWRQKYVHAHLGPFHLIWPEHFLFDRP